MTSPRWRSHLLRNHGVAPDGSLIWPEPPQGRGQMSRGDRFWGWGLVAQGCVRTDGVVVLPPSFDQHLGLSEIVEQLHVQQLVAELAIEALVIAILPR